MKVWPSFILGLSPGGVPVQKVNSDSDANVHVSKKEDLTSGAYTLDIKNNRIRISHKDNDGLKNALSTIQQLLFLNGNKLPITKIEDESRFGYRGMHLDVSRHMFSIDEIKKYIDYLAFYKYNNFHWHLTDDQGWRIEIKSFPKLQEIAAYRNETLIGHYNDEPQRFDKTRYGGYYTQEEIKDVVKYAGQRGINIIPEVDLPGHSSAILAAYPEFGCEEKEYKTATKWGIFYDVLCPKEETFNFLFKVFDEMIELFPSNYYHIGGDECPKNAWAKSAFCQRLMHMHNLENEMELQSYFIKRLELHLNSRGKKIIGWDEILEGGLAPDATVMSWRGTEGGIAAAKLNHDVIMTPTSHCYFDYYQSESPDEPLAIGGYLPLSKVYTLDPIPEELPEDKHQYILGAQGNVWTEYMKDFSHVEYMALARMATLSEVLWGKNNATVEQFYNHLFRHVLRWQSKGVNIANHLSDVDIVITKGDESPKLSLSTAAPDSRFFVQKPNKDSFSALKGSSVNLDADGMYQFYATVNEKKGNVKSLRFSSHLGNSSNLVLKSVPAEKYSGQGPYSLINGINGPEEKYGGSEWLGFDEDDFEVEIGWETSMEVKNISMRFFKGEGQWIYLPSEVAMYAEDDHGDFKMISSLKDIATDSKVASLRVETPNLNTMRLKITAKNYGIIPQGRQGAGHRPWLFVDEIIIN